MIDQSNAQPVAPAAAAEPGDEMLADVRGGTGAGAFAGLPLAHLIGSPLDAAFDANKKAAQTALDFIANMTGPK